MGAAQAAPSLVPPVSSAISMEASEPPMIMCASVLAPWRSASRTPRPFQDRFGGLNHDSWRVLTDADAGAFDVAAGTWLMRLAGLTTPAAAGIPVRRAARRR
jgi:hypothetical protein